MASICLTSRGSNCADSSNVPAAGQRNWARGTNDTVRTRASQPGGTNPGCAGAPYRRVSRSGSLFRLQGHRARRLARPVAVARRRDARWCAPETRAGSGGGRSCRATALASRSRWWMSSWRLEPSIAARHCPEQCQIGSRCLARFALNHESHLTPRRLVGSGKNP